MISGTSYYRVKDAPVYVELLIAGEGYIKFLSRDPPTTFAALRGL